MVTLAQLKAGTRTLKNVPTATLKDWLTSVTDWELMDYISCELFYRTESP